MRARQFVLYAFYTLLVFVLFNFLIWKLFTEQILTRKEGVYTGDLARMGYITDLVQPRKNETDLPRRHLEMRGYRYEPVKMITIGDSFSQGAGFGYNRFYQDHFASAFGWDVLNVLQHVNTRNYMETAVLLANSGFLKKSGAEYLLIESTERKVIGRHTGNVNYDITMPLDELERYYGVNEPPKEGDYDTLPPVSFINNGNIKYLAYKPLYHFSDNAYFSLAYRVKLNRELFSVGRGEEMLFYSHALREAKDHTEPNLKQVHENLNALAKFLKEKHGVTLLFMPAPTKFDLYNAFFSSPGYRKDPFFNILRSFDDKAYRFVDTKAILEPELERGVKDLYYCDDTHWTYKACAAITKALKKEKVLR